MVYANTCLRQQSQCSVYIGSYVKTPVRINIAVSLYCWQNRLIYPRTNTIRGCIVSSLTANYLPKTGVLLKFPDILRIRAGMTRMSVDFRGIGQDDCDHKRDGRECWRPSLTQEDVLLSFFRKRFPAAESNRGSGGRARRLGHHTGCRSWGYAEASFDFSGGSARKLHPVSKRL